MTFLEKEDQENFHEPKKKAAIKNRLAAFGLLVHESSADIMPGVHFFIIIAE